MLSQPVPTKPGQAPPFLRCQKAAANHGAEKSPSTPVWQAVFSTSHGVAVYAAETVLVQYTGAQRTPSGTVEVTTRMVNCTDQPMIVEGRTNFFDEGQRPVEPVSAWQKVHLPPRSVGHYTEMSTNAKRVQTYLTELRSAP